MASEVVDKAAGSLTSADFLDAFNADDESPSKSDDKVDKKEELNLDEEPDKADEDELPLIKKPEIKEDEEDHEVEEPPDEEVQELNLEEEDPLDLVRMPRRAEIKEAFPEIFKKFPQLDHVIQREHQFSELFSTLGDAKAAKASVDDYNVFQAELLNGDIKGVLKAVRKTDEKAYIKLVNNYVEDLARVDPSANLHVANKITRSVLKILDQKAHEMGMNEGEDGEQLSIAIRLVNKALYGTTKLENPQISQEETVSPEKQAFEQEKANFNREKYQAAYTEVGSRMKDLLTKAVTRDIDPKGVIPDYVKGKLVEDVLNALDQDLMGDSRFKNLVSSLWADAHKRGYDKVSTDKIMEALKRKAKTVLPPIMRAKKEKALKGLGVSQRKPRTDDVDDSPITSRGKRDTQITNNRRDGNDRLKMRDGESPLDFFMRD